MLVAQHSGVVKVGADGKAVVSFDMPDFNGTVRLMAMAWSKQGVGHADRDVIVRDPVVVNLSPPRFLRLEDTSRLLVEVDNVGGQPGDYSVELLTGDGLATTSEKTTQTLAVGGRLSLDLDLTGTARLHGAAPAASLAGLIRRIESEVGVTASVGLSHNKFLAKIASDQNKPDGLCVIRPGQGAQFVAALPVRRFHGVGPRGAEKMAQLGIETGADLAAKDIDFLRRHFGSQADYLYRAARGIDLMRSPATPIGLGCRRCTRTGCPLKRRPCSPGGRGRLPSRISTAS